MMVQRRLTRRGGFTLLEVVMAISVGGIVMLSATLFAAESNATFKVIVQNSSLESKLRNSMQRVVAELRGTSFSAVTPALNAGNPIANMVFADAMGIQVVAGEPQLSFGPAKRLVLEYADGEIDDGLDNNGNGLIDEGRLVLIRDDSLGTETRVVLANNVREFFQGEALGNGDDNGNGLTDERGFNVQQNGEILTVMLTLEVPGRQTAMVTRSLVSSIRLRN